MSERPPALRAHVLAAPHATAAERAAALPAAERLAADRGGLLLATCHRVEVHLAGDGAAGEPALPGARVLDAADAARHVVGLAIGLESAVLAEDQVLHQLRTSVAAARRRGPLPVELELLFEAALRAGRLARSWRPVRPRSLADVALDRIARALGAPGAAASPSLEGRTILVVGAGEMGRLAAVGAARRGAVVHVASPTDAHAATLAADVSGRAVPFDPGPAGLAVDGVVVALAGPWTAAPGTLAALAAVPLVVDLSMPAALGPDVVAAMAARHVGLDELAGPAPAAGPGGAPAREGTLARYRERLVRLRERTVADYLERLAAREASAVAAALAERIERDRAAELDALWRRLPDLPPAERAAIEGMTRHLARRLFREPLARLGQDPDGRRRRAAHELFEL